MDQQMENLLNRQKKENVDEHTQWYLNTMFNYQSTLPWFILSDDVGINLAKAFFSRYGEQNPSYINLILYTKCRDILRQPSLASDQSYRQEFLELIPDELWKRRVETELDSYNPERGGSQFDLLVDYKRYLYLRFKSCDIFQEFKGHVALRSNLLKELLENVYETYLNEMVQ